MADLEQNKSAIEYSGEQLSYTELLLRSGYIAGLLPSTRQFGCGRVALLIENRIHAVSAMLGILKAGHAFVSLDTADPEARIRAILKDSDPVMLLTDTENAHRAMELVAGQCVVLDIQAPVSRQRLSRRRREKKRHHDLFKKQRAPNIQDMACLFYTSGSTGEPKGVSQTQRNVCHFVDCYAEKLHINLNDRLSLLYSLSFSAANMDIFGALLNGATVCAYDMRREGIPGLANWIRRQRISVLHAVPTVFRKLVVSLPGDEKLADVRIIDLGGEAVTGRDVVLFKQHFSASAVLVNHLAATEASVISQHMVRLQDENCDILPVGETSRDVEVHIQREDGSAADTGEPGRMVISSPYLSPGYWQREVLNHQVFSADSLRQGWRQLRTEDLGYRDREGLLHFQGRDGTRVKIRGHSVDLTEVEAALRQCEGVNDVAVVISKQDKDPEACMLIAYLVIKNKSDSDIIVLRRQLAMFLPHYMLPSRFIFVETLPLTASGKIDRRHLQQQILNMESQVNVVNLPVNETEQDISILFGKLLEIQKVGRDADFFLLGGDSLLAVELQVRLSKQLGKNFPLSAIIADSTVAGLAETYTRLHRTQAVKSLSPVLVPLREQGNEPVLFLVHGRLGQAPVSPHFLSLLGRDQAVYALQARGLEGDDPPHESVEAMAADYVSAIRLVQKKGPYCIGGFCAGSYVAIRMAQLLSASGELVLPLLLIDPPLLYGEEKSSPLLLSKKEKKHKKSRLDARRYSLEAALYRRVQQQRFNIDVNNKADRHSAVEVALAFHDALKQHTPVPYALPAYLLASQELSGETGWKSGSRLKACFSLPPVLVEVARLHGDIFDVHNKIFEQALQQCMQDIRGA